MQQLSPFESCCDHRLVGTGSKSEVAEAGEPSASRSLGPFGTELALFGRYCQPSRLSAKLQVAHFAPFPWPGKSGTLQGEMPNPCALKPEGVTEHSGCTPDVFSLHQLEGKTAT